MRSTRPNTKMTGYELPRELQVGERRYRIRADCWSVLDILIAMNDPELSRQSKGIVMLKILFPDYREIPISLWEEACEKACAFIDCGQKGDERRHPRTVDWEQDAALIIAGVNAVARGEVRDQPHLHWWTFFGYFMEIREGLFAAVASIRQKKAKHKKLEKWERDFYRENKELIDFQKKESQEERRRKENLVKWL